MNRRRFIEGCKVASFQTLTPGRQWAMKGRHETYITINSRHYNEMGKYYFWEYNSPSVISGILEERVLLAIYEPL